MVVKFVALRPGVCFRMAFGHFMCSGEYRGRPSVAELHSGKADSAMLVQDTFPNETALSGNVNSLRLRYADAAAHGRLHSNLSPEVMTFTRSPEQQAGCCLLMILPRLTGSETSSSSGKNGGRRRLGRQESDSRRSGAGLNVSSCQVHLAIAASDPGHWINCPGPGFKAEVPLLTPLKESDIEMRAKWSRIA
jgi:hypothetical protein